MFDAVADDGDRRRQSTDILSTCLVREPRSAVAAMCADDLVCDEPAVGRTVLGPDSIREFVTRMARGYPDYSFTLMGLYAELGAWVVEHALTVAGPVHETYLAGPRDDPDPATWRTEIGWPVFRLSPHRNRCRRRAVKRTPGEA